MGVLRRSVLACVCLLAISFAAVCHADDEFGGEDVHVLDKDTFDPFINQELSLVEFYAPWCGHCKQLAPEYAEAATLLKKDGIPIANVDATKHGEIAGRYNVGGYPTLKVFRDGKPYDYNGPRKAQGIYSYMKKQMGPAAKPIEDRSDLEKVIRSDPDTQYAVIGFFKSQASQLQSAFTLLASKLRDKFVFGKVMNNEKLAEKYGVKDGEGLVAFYKGQPTVYEGNTKQQNIEDFIKANSVPLVGELTENNQGLYQERGLPVGKFYMKIDKSANSKTNTYYMNRLKKVATEFLNKLTVVMVDKESSTFKAHADAVGIDKSSEHGFVIEHNNKQYKYEGFEGKTFDAKALIAWIHDYLKDEVPAYVRSEKAPKNNDQLPVKVATGNNFDALVNDPEKDVLIEFYAPWCGHCKALEPKYKELGEKIQKQTSDIIVAKIDATANEYDRSRFEVKGYPTIFLVPAKKGAKPILYEGGREIEEMFEFIKDNARNKSALGSKKKKTKKNKKKKVVEDDDDDDE